MISPIISYATGSSTSGPKGSRNFRRNLKGPGESIPVRGGPTREKGHAHPSEQKGWPLSDVSGSVTQVFQDLSYEASNGDREQEILRSVPQLILVQRGYQAAIKIFRSKDDSTERTIEVIA
jgi:hypothetical protein